MMNRPGKRVGHHSPASSEPRADCTRVPRLAWCAGRPRPRNDRADSCQMACGTMSTAASAACGRTPGSRWRTAIRHREEPPDTAASIYGRERRERTSARTIRAVDSQCVSATETTTGQTPGRNMATMKMPRSRCGTDEKTSTSRMTTRSVQPPTAPASAPTAVPMTVATTAATTPTRRRRAARTRSAAAGRGPRRRCRTDGPTRAVEAWRRGLRPVRRGARGAARRGRRGRPPRRGRRTCAPATRAWSDARRRRCAR